MAPLYDIIFPVRQLVEAQDKFLDLSILCHIFTKKGVDVKKYTCCVMYGMLQLTYKTVLLSNKLVFWRYDYTRVHIMQICVGLFGDVH